MKRLKIVNQDKNLLIRIISFLFVFFIFGLTVKGTDNIYHYSENLDAKIGGPFETSGSNSRYALTKSIVERGTFLFDEKLGKFAAPDMVISNGKMMSIFTPGVSFLGVPFYWLGYQIGLEQLITYLINPLALVLCAIMIFKFVLKLADNYIAGIIAALVFVLATNAIVYAGTYTQHILSSLFLLLAIYIALKDKVGVKDYLILGFVYAFGVLVDLPNFLILLPAITVAVSKSIFFKKSGKNKKITLNLKMLTILFTFVPLILVFLYYNQKTTGSYFKLAQMIGRSEGVEVDVETHVDLSEEEGPDEQYSFDLPFESRYQIRGLNVLLVNEERGYPYYYPILILALLGFVAVLKVSRKNKLAAGLAASEVILIIIMYSMFGDPWGGWAFGARYLIPANAILSVFLGVAIAKYGKNFLFFLIFIILLGISSYTNTIGALTTSAIPPKGEAQSFSEPLPHTVKFNLRMVRENDSSSYVYNAFLKNKIDLRTYILTISAAETVFIIYLYILMLAKNKDLWSLPNTKFIQKKKHKKS